MPLAIVLASTLSSCAPLRLVPTRVCQDGLPARVLVHVACRDGICGWTCEPDRWTTNTR